MFVRLLIFLQFLTLTIYTYSQKEDVYTIENYIAEYKDYEFLRQFEADANEQTSKVSYSVILSKGFEYILIFCYDPFQSYRNVNISLLDRDKIEINKTLLQPYRSYISNISFECPATGVYYIDATFEEDKRKNGEVVLKIIVLRKKQQEDKQG